MSNRQHIPRDELHPRLRRIVGHPREHFNADGSQKKDYNTRKKAQMVADRMRTAGEGELEVYRCPFCGKYHIGHQQLLPREQEFRHILQLFKNETALLNQLRHELRQVEDTVSSYHMKIEKLETDIQLHYYQLKTKLQNEKPTFETLRPKDLCD